MIALRWGGATDVGCERDENEDSLFAEPPLFLVADGMGGHAAGAVASRLAVEVLGRLATAPTTDSRSVLTAVADANEAILAAARQESRWAGMGTTLVGLALVADLDQEYWLAFNVGDSRLYRWADGVLEQLTVDHSEVQERIDAGEISAAEGRTAAGRNVLTRALGTQPAPLADCWLLSPGPGERFLLCSDGLSTELTDAHIRSALAAAEPPDVLARRLVADALHEGGRDNVTVVVVDVVDSTSEDSA
jgi:protein phosphatase